MKAQATIIGFIIIAAIALVIVSATLFWSRPLIERAQDEQEVMRLELKFIELDEAIKHVASSQSSMALQFDLNRGVLSLDSKNNTIVYRGQYSTEIPSPRRAVFGNLSLSDLETFNLEKIGELGTDEPGILIEQGSVEFFLHYRPLNSSGKCYRIKLIPGNAPGGGVGSNTIVLTWKGENTTTFPNCSRGLTDQLVEFNVI